MKSIFALFLSIFTVSQAETLSKTDPFERVFSVISSDKIFSTPLAGLMKQLDTLCKPNTGKDSNFDRDGNVECGKLTGVKDMDITGTATPAIAIITATFIGLDRCAYLRQNLTKQYGKPRESNGPCNAHWNLKAGKNGRARSVGFERSKDGTQVSRNRRRAGLMNPLHATDAHAVPYRTTIARVWLCKVSLGSK